MLAAMGIFIDGEIGECLRGSKSDRAECDAAPGNARRKDYARDRPLEQDEDSIMRAVPHDHDGLIALFCLVACKR